MEVRRVYFLLLPQLRLLDFSGAARVFDSASGLGVGYELNYLAEQHIESAAVALALTK